MLTIRIYIIPWILLVIDTQIQFIHGGFCQQQAQSSFQFHTFGKVRSKEECHKRCCKKSHCSLSIVNERNCFGVTCTHAQLCKSIINELAQFEGHQVNKRSLAYSYQHNHQHSNIANDTLLRKPRSMLEVSDDDDDGEDDDNEDNDYDDENIMDTPAQDEDFNEDDEETEAHTEEDDSKQKCKPTKQKNSIIPKRRKSFKFKKLSNTVENMSECNKKCCSSDDCLLAFTLAKKCYGVICVGDGSCHTNKDKLPAMHISVSSVENTNLEKVLHPTKPRSHRTTRIHSTTKKRKLSTTKHHTTTAKHHVSTLKHAHKTSVRPSKRRKEHHIKFDADGGEDEDGGNDTNRDDDDDRGRETHKKHKNHGTMHDDEKEDDDDDEDEMTLKRSKPTSFLKVGEDGNELHDDIQMLHQLHHVTAEGLTQMDDDLMSEQESPQTSFFERKTGKKSHHKKMVNKADDNDDKNLMSLQRAGKKNKMGEKIKLHFKEEKDPQKISDALEGDDDEEKASKKFVLPEKEKPMPMMNDDASIDDSIHSSETRKTHEDEIHKSSDDDEAQKTKSSENRETQSDKIQNNQDDKIRNSHDDEARKTHSVPVHDDSEEESNHEKVTRGDEKNKNAKKIVHDDGESESGQGDIGDDRSNTHGVGKSKIEHNKNHKTKDKTENIILQKIENLEKKLSSKKESELTPTEKHKKELLVELHKLQDKSKNEKASHKLSSNSKRHKEETRVKKTHKMKGGKRGKKEKSKSSANKKKTKPTKGSKKPVKKKKMQKGKKHKVMEEDISGSGSGSGEEDFAKEVSQTLHEVENNKKKKHSHSKQPRKRKQGKKEKSNSKENGKHKKKKEQKRKNSSMKSKKNTKEKQKHDSFKAKKPNKSNRTVTENTTSSSHVIASSLKDSHATNATSSVNSTNNVLNEKKDRIPSNGKKEIKKDKISDEIKNSFIEKLLQKKMTLNNSSDHYDHKEDIFKEFEAFKKMYDDTKGHLQNKDFRKISDELNNEGSGGYLKSHHLSNDTLQSMVNATHLVTTTLTPASTTSSKTVTITTTAKSNIIMTTTKPFLVNTTMSSTTIATSVKNMSTPRPVIPKPFNQETNDIKQNVSDSSKKSIPTIEHKHFPTHRHTKPLPTEPSHAPKKHKKIDGTERPTKHQIKTTPSHKQTHPLQNSAIKTVPTVAVDGMENVIPKKTNKLKKKYHKKNKPHENSKHHVSHQFQEESIKDLSKEPAIPALPKPKPPKKIPSLNINIEEDPFSKHVSSTTEKPKVISKGELFTLHKSNEEQNKEKSHSHHITGNKRIQSHGPTMKPKSSSHLTTTRKPHHSTHFTTYQPPKTTRRKNTHQRTPSTVMNEVKHSPTRHPTHHSTVLHRMKHQPTHHPTGHHKTTHHPTGHHKTTHHPTGHHKTTPHHNGHHRTTVRPNGHHKTTHHPTGNQKTTKKKQHQPTLKKHHKTTPHQKKHPSLKIASPTRHPKLQHKVLPTKLSTLKKISTLPTTSTELKAQTTSIPQTYAEWQTLKTSDQPLETFPKVLYNENPTFGNPEYLTPPIKQGEDKILSATPTITTTPLIDYEEKIQFLPTPTHKPKTPFNKLKKLLMLAGLNPHAIDNPKIFEEEIARHTPHQSKINELNMPHELNQPQYDLTPWMGKPNLNKNIPLRKPHLNSPSHQGMSQTFQNTNGVGKPLESNHGKLDENHLNEIYTMKQLNHHQSQNQKMFANPIPNVPNVHNKPPNSHPKINKVSPNIKANSGKNTQKPVNKHPNRLEGGITNGGSKNSLLHQQNKNIQSPKKESPIEIIHRLLGNDVIPKTPQPPIPEKLEIVKKPSNLDNFFAGADRRHKVVNATGPADIKHKGIDSNRVHDHEIKSRPVASKPSLSKLNNYFDKIEVLNKSKVKEDHGKKKSELDETPKVRENAKKPIEQLHPITGCSVKKDLINHAFLHSDGVGYLYKMKGSYDMNSCMKQCCDHDTCHIAFLENDICNLVKCKNRSICDMVSPTNKYSRIVFLEKNKVINDGAIHSYCPAQHAVGVPWEKTPEGTEAIRSCPRDAVGKAKRVCDSHSRWKAPDFTDCISEDYANLVLKANGLGYTSNARDLAKELDDVTTQTIDNSLIFGGDIRKATYTVTNIASYLQENDKEDFQHQHLRSVTRSVSNLFDETNKQEWSNMKQDFLGPSKLMKSLDAIGLYAAKRLPRAMEMKPVLTRGILVSVAKFDSSYKRYTFPNYSIAGLKGWTNRKDFIQIPKSSFAKDTSTLISSATFKTLSSLLPHRWNTKKHVTFTDGFVVNSNVISSTLKPSPKVPIEPPVTIVLHHLKVMNAETKCVFWDFNSSESSGGSWSTEGCWVARTNRTTTVCKCNHLTHFALLSNTNNQKISIKEQAREHTIAAVWLGIPLSIVLMVAALYTCFTWSRTPRRRHVVIIDKKPVLPERDVVVTQTVSERHPASPERHLYATNFTPSPSELEWEHAWDFLTNSDFNVFHKKQIKSELKARLLKQRLRWEQKRRGNLSTESSVTTSTKSSVDTPCNWRHKHTNLKSKTYLKEFTREVFDLSTEASQPLTRHNSTLTVHEQDENCSLNTIASHLETFSPVAISSPHSASFEDDNVYTRDEFPKASHSYLQISFDAEVEEISDSSGTVYCPNDFLRREFIVKVGENDVMRANVIASRQFQPCKHSLDENYETENEMLSDCSPDSIEPQFNIEEFEKNLSSETVSSDSGNVSSFDSENISSNHSSPIHSRQDICEKDYGGISACIFDDVIKSVAVDLVETDLTEAEILLLQSAMRLIQETHLFNETSFSDSSDFSRRCHDDCCILHIERLFHVQTTFEISVGNESFVSSCTVVENMETDRSECSFISSTSDEDTEINQSNELNSKVSTTFSLTRDNIPAKASNTRTHVSMSETYKSHSEHDTLYQRHQAQVELLAHRKKKPKTLIHRTTSANPNILRKPVQKDKQSTSHVTNPRPQTPHMKSYIALRQQCRRNDSMKSRTPSTHSKSKTSLRYMRRNSLRKVKPGICVNTSSLKLDSPCRSDTTATSEDISLQDVHSRHHFRTNDRGVIRKDLPNEPMRGETCSKFSNCVVSSRLSIISRSNTSRPSINKMRHWTPYQHLPNEEKATLQPSRDIEQWPPDIEQLPPG